MIFHCHFNESAIDRGTCPLGDYNYYTFFGVYYTDSEHKNEHDENSQREVSNYNILPPVFVFFAAWNTVHVIRISSECMITLTSAMEVSGSI